MYRKSAGEMRYAVIGMWWLGAQVLEVEVRISEVAHVGVAMVCRSGDFRQFWQHEADRGDEACALYC